MSDFSAVVYGHHVVWPNPRPIEGGPDHRYDGEHWFWEVEVADREGEGVVGLYEALTGYADKDGASFSVGVVVDESATADEHPAVRVPACMSYRAGDRQWAAEQAALRGVLV